MSNELCRNPVLVIWDYENCHVPKGMSGLAVLKQFKLLFSRFGKIIAIQAYCSVASVPLPLREELQLGGVTMIDVSAERKRKEMADKMVLTAMFVFALDNPPPSTIILISGDVDYSAAVSVLQLRGYKIIIVPPQNASRKLLTIADEVLHWSSVTNVLSTITMVQKPEHQQRPTSKLPLQSQPSRSPKVDRRHSSSSSSSSSNSSGVAGDLDNPFADEEEIDPSIASLTLAFSAHSIERTPDHIDEHGERAEVAYFPPFSGELTPEEIQAAVVLNDFFDICLEFCDSGNYKALSSAVGSKYTNKYPIGHYKGRLKDTTKLAIRHKFVAAEGSAGNYTLIFNISKITAAWEHLHSMNQPVLVVDPSLPI